MIKYLALFLPIFLFALDQNSTVKNSEEINVSKEKLAQQHLEEQMKREAKYAKEKMFYTGKDYNLSEHQVDSDALKHIQTIEPEYDFDMDEGVYSD